MTPEFRRSLVLAGLGVLLGLGLVAAFFARGERAPPSAPQGALGTAVPALAAVPAPSPVSPPEAAVPAFDIVRVEPNGDAVVAGRAAPNTVVEMLIDGRAVARALADPNGQFAIVPPPLPPGHSEIVLRSTGADGRETRSKGSVAVVVAAARDARPLVALTAPDRPTVVLSQPDAPAPTPRAEAPAAAPDAAAPVKIVSVDAQEGGRLFVSGRAAPGATLRLYLNGTLVAPASVGADGTVTFTIGRGVAPGAYTVRVDQVDSVSGKVRGRAEVPFAVPAARAVEPRARPVIAAAGSPTPAAVAPAAPGVFVDAVNTARIIRGDSLWQISRRLYGRGERYTVIYDANQGQIRNPDLIYPGQIFVLPGEDGAPAAPRG